MALDADCRTLRRRAFFKDERRDLFGYASVNFGHVISTKMFARQNGINFIKLDKDARFVHPAQLAEKLMNGIGYVMPILPVPLIAQVFRQSNAESLSEIEIIAAVHKIIDSLIDLGAPLNAAEKPAKKTIQKALALMVHYTMLEASDGRFRTVEESADRLAYYAESIAHWFNGVAHIDPQQHRLVAPATA